MGLLSAVKNKIIHRDEGMDMGGPDEIRSHVLGEPPNDFAEPMPPQSRYAPPALSRMDPVRTHNIGPGPNEPAPSAAPIGRTANDLMPADRMGNENPMFSPAPPSPFEPAPPQGPPTLTNPPQQNNERIMEKIDYIREDIRSLKHEIELMNERVKNIQNRIEHRGY
ncbi:hypothetical protein CL614_04950 [archaeon]|nr:hypothetical protein [archaeon]|tara:strand:- start:1545 stop:2042 length:498 start_codon:yes stop_codon:yes gene_type:complete